jgi:hypothetical protein
MRRGIYPAWWRPWITPGLSGTVVCTRFGVPSDRWLNQGPVERIVSHPMKKNNGRTTVANAIDVYLKPAQVD